MKRFAWFALGAALMALVLHLSSPRDKPRHVVVDRREMIPRHDRQEVLNDFAGSTFLYPLADGVLVTWVRRHSLMDHMGLRPGDVVHLSSISNNGETIIVTRGEQTLLLSYTVSE